MPKRSTRMTARTREETQQMKERLRYALALSQKAQNQVAREVGASSSVASAWLDLDNDVLPGGKFLMRLPKALGVNGHWLITGEGSWHPLPTSGRRDVLLMEGVEIGARMVAAEVELGLQRAKDELALETGRAISRARAAAEDAASDEGASAVHRAPARRGAQK